MKERGIIFSGEMVRALLEDRKTRHRIYCLKGEDPASPEHLARRLANGLDAAPKDGCWIWKRTRNNMGYGTLRVHGRGTVYAHRLSFELSHGPIDSVLMVCHKCDNPSCINPDHLFLGTHIDNMRDASAKGRIKLPGTKLSGEENPAHKLNRETVAEIRSLLPSHTQSELAQKYGISQSTVSQIKLNRTWVIE